MAATTMKTLIPVSYSNGFVVNLRASVFNLNAFIFNIIFYFRFL